MVLLVEENRATNQLPTVELIECSTTVHIRARPTAMIMVPILMTDITFVLTVGMIVKKGGGEDGITRDRHEDMESF
ncbi:hypothetical protein M9H77_36416 [Catharanthus roseus]|uniref:Uncharacterized protein n=1 Tax=Catharanthus roseus TaxID=4058 RepID=A0ACB9ZUC6_CATRO|nr:hypothetical protein M9H77_36416 [Catharanthus roseus]